MPRRGVFVVDVTGQYWLVLMFCWIICDLSRIASFTGESDVLADILEDVLRSFEDVRIHILTRTLVVCRVVNFREILVESKTSIPGNSVKTRHAVV